MDMDVQRLSAFADGEAGGNPAGVWIGETMPDVETMARVAAEVGYSETVFSVPEGGDGEGAKTWRTRYFSPESEVPFCGHATIALGAALTERFGPGVYPLTLNEARITVEGWREVGRDDGRLLAALQSPPTRSEPLGAALTQTCLDLFGYSLDDLDMRIPPARLHGGAGHLCLALNSRAALAAMRYDLDKGRRLMVDEGVVTVLLAWAESPTRFHTRNPFASGGVYEDPATGAATAALGGYLRDLDWPHGGAIEVIQGEDMGARSHLRAEIPPEKGASIRVSGATRPL